MEQNPSPSRLVSRKILGRAAEQGTYYYIPFPQNIPFIVSRQICFHINWYINKTEVELTMAGTPNWAAPEVLLPSLKDPKPKKALHGHPSDVWGVGLLALYMRTRKHPTFTLNKDELKFQLETFIQDLDKSRTSINDENLFTFIKQCLKLEPKERIRKENLLLEFDYEPPTPTNDIGMFVYNNTYI